MDFLTQWKGKTIREVFDQTEVPQYTKVVLRPLPGNPLHITAVQALYSGGYYYCEGSNMLDGPDYYWPDAFRYCRVYIIGDQAC